MQCNAMQSHDTCLKEFELYLCGMIKAICRHDIQSLKVQHFSPTVTVLLMLSVAIFI